MTITPDQVEHIYWLTDEHVTMADIETILIALDIEVAR